MLASVYTDDYERGHAMGIALGGLALGVLGEWHLAGTLGLGGLGALRTFGRWLQEGGVLGRGRSASISFPFPAQSQVNSFSNII